MNYRVIPVFGLDEDRPHRPEAGGFAMGTMESSSLHHLHRFTPHPFFQVFCPQARAA